jgi:hypothetical protein
MSPAARSETEPRREDMFRRKSLPKHPEQDLRYAM